MGKGATRVIVTNGPGAWQRTTSARVAVTEGRHGEVVFFVARLHSQPPRVGKALAGQMNATSMWPSQTVSGTDVSRSHTEVTTIHRQFRYRVPGRWSQANELAAEPST